MVEINLIVAMDLNHGIGRDNKLPWHIPEDLKRFKKITLGHPILMGRKTFDSIGKALPGRRNIVITRNPDWRAEGVETACSLEAAIAMVEKEPEAYVIGGAEIFKQAIAKADRLLLTLVYMEAKCDTFFPYFLHKGWEITESEHCWSEAGGTAYCNITYESAEKSRIRRLRAFGRHFIDGLALLPVARFVMARFVKEE